MDKKEILQFEEDDTSRTGINGKQVFFTKRINGKTIRNKEKEQPEIANVKEKDDKKDELFIEFKNITYHPKTPPQKQLKKSNKKKTTQKKPIRKIIKNNKKGEKNKKKGRTLRIISIILILSAIGAFAFVSPIFNVEKITVLGNEQIATDTIISLSNISDEKNIFQISKKSIIKNIKENAYINDVAIKKILPSTVQISVQERKIAYQIKVINSYVYIDYQGYILQNSSKRADVPIIEGLATEQEVLLNGKRIVNEDIEHLNSILKIMESAKSFEINNLISKITITNKQYILDLSKEKKIVYLGSGKNLTNQMTYVKLIIEKEKNNKGKIFVNGDISAGFKPYFREE